VLIDLGLLDNKNLIKSALGRVRKEIIAEYVLNSKCSFAFLYTCGDFNKAHFLIL
jgi:hypothetical protein